MSVRRVLQLLTAGVLACAATLPAAGIAHAADEVPASVAFSSTCAGIHAVFTTASEHSTEFDVTTPAGGTDAVMGSATRDYAADATDMHISVAFDGTSQAYDWTDPGTCASPLAAQADPQVSAANRCVTGINLTLSNINGTAAAAFTVVEAGSTSETVSVRAGQIKRLAFPVKEDTTRTVTVSADGMAPQAFAYHKNCASVLGVKHTRGPSSTPPASGTGGTASGQGALPFTGFNSGLTAAGGGVLVGLGFALCLLAGRRRQPQRAPRGR